MTGLRIKSMERQGGETGKPLMARPDIFLVVQDHASMQAFHIRCKVLRRRMPYPLPTLYYFYMSERNVPLHARARHRHWRAENALSPAIPAM